MRQPSYILDNDELQEAINKAYEHYENMTTVSLRTTTKEYIEKLTKIQCERARTINLDK